MAKKRRTVDTNAPGWIVTYGDMMSLLLCFFVLLFAFSEPQVEKIQELLESFRRTFGGYRQVSVPIPGKDIGLSIFDKIELYEQQRDDPNMTGYTEALGFQGDQVQVTVVDKGIKITFGGKLLFDENKAVLKEGSFANLQKFADLMRGFPNRIEIIGHASAGEDNPWQLGYARAKAVLDYVTKKGGLDEKYFVLSSGGKFDSKQSNFPNEREFNRRVEIIVTEETVK